MKFIDLFCGLGGFSIGLEKSGHKLIKGFDNWEDAGKSFESYFGNSSFCNVDLANVKSSFILKEINLKSKEIDLIVGGPPCQGFSSMGIQKNNDPRNTLIISFAKIISEIKPKYFILENVHRINSKKFEKTVQEIKKLFVSSGYSNIDSGILDAQDFGVPQRRKRFFLIGARDKAQAISLPTPKTNQKKLLVGDVIMDLIGKENKTSNHIPMNHNDIVKARYKYIPEGGKLDVKLLPNKLVYGSRSDFKDKKIKNFSHIYQRLSRFKVSGTIVPGHNAFHVHPTELRSLTVREAARIQTIPDRSIFFGSRQNQAIQVGNAVPPKLAEAFGYILKELEK